MKDYAIGKYIGTKNFYKASFTTKQLDVMVASWASGVIGILPQRSTEEPSLFKDQSDLTCPSSNHILDIDIAVSAVYDTF